MGDDLTEALDFYDKNDYLQVAEVIFRAINEIDRSGDET